MVGHPVGLALVRVRHGADGQPGLDPSYGDSADPSYGDSAGRHGDSAGRHGASADGPSLGREAS